MDAPSTTPAPALAAHVVLDYRPRGEDRNLFDTLWRAAVWMAGRLAFAWLCIAAWLIFGWVFYTACADRLAMSQFVPGGCGTGRGEIQEDFFLRMPVRLAAGLLCWSAAYDEGRLVRPTRLAALCAAAAWGTAFFLR